MVISESITVEAVSSVNADKKKRYKSINVRRSAMDLLARREHSRLELARKLHKKFSLYDEIETVLDQLIQDQLLSDERFTEAYVNYRQRAGFGPVKIAVELRERGINEVLVDRYLQLRSHHWRAAASTARHKKFGANGAVDVKEKLRQQRFLLYRCFRRDDFEHII